MSDKYCAHGFWLAKGCDECRDYERLVESQASDNAMIRDLTAKLQDAEAGIRLAEDWIDGLGRSLGLTRDDDGCWNMEGIEVTVDELRSRAEAAEADLEEAKSQSRGMFRQATLFREKLTDCESALHEAEEKNQDLIKDYAEWMSPDDYVPLAQKVDNLAALVRILVHSLRKVNPNSSNIIRAMDYLKRKGLTGSILRDDEPQPQEIPESGGHIESADCWCGPTVEEHPGGTLIIHNQTH